MSHQLTCTPTTVRGRSTVPGVDYLLPSFVSKYTLAELRSATRYSCSLQASTQKGFGPSASIVVWTEPYGRHHVLYISVLLILILLVVLVLLEMNMINVIIIIMRPFL